MISKSKSITCYIGMGSNLDSPKAQLQSAIKYLNNNKSINVFKISSFYQTKPFGYQDQPDFINAVAGLKTSLSSHSLIKELLDIESMHKRERGENRNMPRTLDLDILFYGDRAVNTYKLQIPHPRMQDRAFVLVPLNEIAPKLTRDYLGASEYVKKFKLDKEFRSLKNSIVAKNID